MCRTVLHFAAVFMKTSKQASKKSPRVSVTLSEDESSKLDSLAKDSKLTRSWLGRHAICRLLEIYATGQLELPLRHERL